MSDQLSKQTSIFGLHLWIVLGVSAGTVVVLLLFLLSLYFTTRSNTKSNSNSNSKTIPINPTSTLPLNPLQETQRLSGIEQQALLHEIRCHFQLLPILHSNKHTVIATPPFISIGPSWCGVCHSEGVGCSTSYGVTSN